MLTIKRVENGRWAIDIQRNGGTLGVVGNCLSDNICLLAWKIARVSIDKYFGPDFHRTGECLYWQHAAEKDAKLRDQVIRRVTEACRNGYLVQLEATNWEAPETTPFSVPLSFDKPITELRTFEGRQGAEDLAEYLKTYYPCCLIVRDKCLSEEYDSFTVGIMHYTDSKEERDWYSSLGIKFNDGTAFYCIKSTTEEIVRELEQYISDRVFSIVSYY